MRAETHRTSIDHNTIVLKMWNPQAQERLLMSISYLSTVIECSDEESTMYQLNVLLPREMV